MDITYPDINRNPLPESTYNIGVITNEIKNSCVVIRDRTEPNWSGATLKPKSLDLKIVPPHSQFTFLALGGRIAYGFETEESPNGRIVYVWLEHQCVSMPVNDVVTIEKVDVETTGQVKTTYTRGVVSSGLQTLLPYFEPGNRQLEKPAKILSV